MRWIALSVTIALWASAWPQMMRPEVDTPPCHIMVFIALTGALTLWEFIKHRKRGNQSSSAGLDASTHRSVDKRIKCPAFPDTIERLALPAADADLVSLAELLVDAVESGAAVSLLPPLAIDRAREWWRGTLASFHPRGVVLVARDSNNVIVGTVQLQPAWAPNQQHRAEVCKLLVHRRSARAGLGRSLMEAIEQTARDAGFTLLTLDARRGGVADYLYDKLGWTQVGVIPRYAVNPDGKALHDTVIYYKELPGR